MKRLILSLFSGLVISLALFWLMQFMIGQNQQPVQVTEELRMTEFVRLKRESQVKTRDRKVPEPPKPEKRPPPKPQIHVQQTNVANVAAPDLDMPTLDIPIDSSRFGGSALSGISLGRGKVSTNVIPLVRIPPRYPMRAMRRKIEGWVKVEFTITESGAVKDAKVIESHPSDIFNQAALRAIAKWKFKAKIIDGVAFEQRAAQILNFKLSK